MFVDIQILGLLTYCQQVKYLNKNTFYFRMEYLIALLSGINAKIYDEIADNEINVSETFKEALKGIQWTTLAILSVQDFNFSFIMYLINLAAYFANSDAYKLPYEYSLLLVFPFLMFLNYDTVQYLTPINLLIILPCIIGIFLEGIIFTEDVSLKKCIFRITAVFFFFIFLISFSDYLSPTILKLLTFFIGYLISSSCYQVYILYNKKTPNEDTRKHDKPESDEKST